METARQAGAAEAVAGTHTLLLTEGELNTVCGALKAGAVRLEHLAAECEEADVCRAFLTVATEYRKLERSINDRL